MTLILILGLVAWFGGALALAWWVFPPEDR
jgi:hypothetical protein